MAPEDPGNELGESSTAQTRRVLIFPGTNEQGLSPPPPPVSPIASFSFPERAPFDSDCSSWHVDTRSDTTSISELVCLLVHNELGDWDPLL